MVAPRVSEIVDALRAVARAHTGRHGGCSRCDARDLLARLDAATEPNPQDVEAAARAAWGVGGESDPVPFPPSWIVSATDALAAVLPVGIPNDPERTADA